MAPPARTKGARKHTGTDPRQTPDPLPRLLPAGPSRQTVPLAGPVELGWL